MDISAIYSKEAVTLVKDAPLISAAHLMRDVFVSDVIIVEQQNTEGETPIGILTDRDIVVKVVAEGRDIDNFQISDVMNTNIITVNNHADIVDCIKLMNKENMSRMPVINDLGFVVGVISMSDILVHVQQLLDMAVNVNRSI